MGGFERPPVSGLDKATSSPSYNATSCGSKQTSMRSRVCGDLKALPVKKIGHYSYWPWGNWQTALDGSMKRCSTLWWQPSDRRVTNGVVLMYVSPWICVSLYLNLHPTLSCLLRCNSIRRGTLFKGGADTTLGIARKVLTPRPWCGLSQTWTMNWKCSHCKLVQIEQFGWQLPRVLFLSYSRCSFYCVERINFTVITLGIAPVDFLLRCGNNLGMVVVG